MESFINLYSLKNLALLLISLAGLILLVRHQRQGWLLLMAVLLWHILEGLYFDNAIVETLLYQATSAQSLTIALMTWGYYQWGNLPTSSQSILGNNEHILDEIVEERQVVETYQISRHNIQQPLLVGLALFVVLLGFNTYWNGMSFFIDILFKVAYLLSFYLLAKRYVEGWLLLIITFLVRSVLYGFYFHLYTIARLAIYVWGYSEWKKLVRRETS